MIQQSFEELQTNLRYQLKVNDLDLVSSDKQNLTECLQNMLGLQSGRLAEIISDHIAQQQKNGTLPRKLESMFKDQTLLDQYRKYPNLVNFYKITLQMLSHLHQTKITVYSLNSQGILSGLIINDQGYQQNLKIARINSSFFQVKDYTYSTSTSFIRHNSTNSNSSKLFQAFNTDTKQKLQDQPTTPLLTKSLSNIEPRTLAKQQQPILKSIDEISLQNYHRVQPQQVHVPIMEQYQQNQNMYYYNQYPQMYYQPTPYIYVKQSQLENTENKSQGFINGFGHMQNNQSVSPTKMSNSRRQNNNRLMEIDENARYTGRLKFFDDNKNYGFIIMDADQSDIFVHCDDLQKAGISKDRVKSYKQSQQILRFQFKVMSYVGKYKQSRKAVQLIIIDNNNNHIGKPLYP